MIGKLNGSSAKKQIKKTTLIWIFKCHIVHYRNSHLEKFCRKAALKKFPKLSLFLNFI